MEQDERDEPRAANDSRKRNPVETRKAATVESKPSLGQRWRDYQPTKAILFWACLASVVLTMLVGFTWGGWVTGGTAQKAADALAKDAVVQRLIPICVAQFDLDPAKAEKVAELDGIEGTRDKNTFVKDQGWTIMPGEEKADRKVENACIKLLLEMSQ
jgi:hypothetical protein